MKRILSLLAVLVLVSGCSDRSGAGLPSSSASESSSSSAVSSSSAPSPASSSALESKPEEVSSEMEDFPLPILTDAEQELLLEELAVFVQHLGAGNQKNAAEIDPAAMLPAILAEIDRSRDLHGYFFSKNSSGAELISEQIVQETATRMFGISVFPQLEQYDLDTQCYPYTPAQTAAPAYTVSGPMGAPGETLTYTVTLDSGVSYIYTCKIVRVNSIPFLQLQSIQRENA